MPLGVPLPLWVLLVLQSVGEGSFPPGYPDVPSGVGGPPLGSCALRRALRACLYDTPPTGTELTNPYKILFPWGMEVSTGMKTPRGNIPGPGFDSRMLHQSKLVHWRSGQLLYTVVLVAGAPAAGSDGNGSTLTRLSTYGW